jgi:hypothetical protein
MQTTLCQSQIDGPAAFITGLARIRSLLENLDLMAFLHQQQGQQRSSKTRSYDMDAL